MGVPGRRRRRRETRGGPAVAKPGLQRPRSPRAGQPSARRPRLSARGGAREQDGGVGPVRLHQVHAALPLRGALAGPTALQGRWAPGVVRSAPRRVPGIRWASPGVDRVPLACRLGPARPLLAVSGGAEPGGHQSTVSQRSGADFSHPSFGRGCPLLPLGGRAPCLHFLARNPNPKLQS